MALTVVEWLLFVVYHRKTGRGLPPREIGLTILSGAFLLLALREALVAAWWGWVAASLSGALLAHLADLGHRLRSGPPRRP